MNLRSHEEWNMFYRRHYSKPVIGPVKEWMKLFEIWPYIYDLDTWESKTLSNLEALSMKMNRIPCFVQGQLTKTWICAAELLQRGTYKGWVSPVCGHSYTPACAGSWADNFYWSVIHAANSAACSQALDNLHSTSWEKSNTNPNNTDKICSIIFRFDNHWC